VSGCGRKKKYGKPGEPPTHCAGHGKPLGLVDEYSKRCAAEGCDTKATYGKKGSKTATHCAPHGEPLGLVDVLSRKCVVEGCDTQASYGKKGSNSATHCAPHGETLGLVNVVSKKCAAEGCDTKATYGKKGSKTATHCAPHGEPLGLVNVKSKKCAAEGCDTIVHEFVYCANHDPDNTRIRQFGEGVARDVLAKAYPKEEGWELFWNNGAFAGNPENKTDCMEPDTLNSKNFRGDFFIKHPTLYPGRTAYVEHDEFQHTSYDKSCDAARTCAILQWRTDDTPVFVGRINPDAYKVPGRTIPGWQSKNPKTKDFDRNPAVIKKRYETLIRDVNAYFEMPLEELVRGPEVRYGFYCYDNAADESTVQCFSLHGPVINEHGQVTGLDLRPL